MPAPRVIANLLVGGNGATVKAGSSKALTNSADRRRFHALRSLAKAIVIGGSTYRNEPYQRNAKDRTLPIYVSSVKTQYLIDQELALGVTFASVSPTRLVARALEEVGSPILIEGGVNFLHELIENRIIDELHITRVQVDGDDYYLDESLLSKNYKLELQEQEGETNFEIWRPISH